MNTIDNLMALADNYAREVATFASSLARRECNGSMSPMAFAAGDARAKFCEALTEALSPKGQAIIRELLADGTFVERAIGTMQEQERELMKHGIGGDK